MDLISNNSILLAQKGLDFNWQKQKIISNNIANIETPGYKAKYATFEDELKSSIKKISNRSATRNDIRNAISSTRMTVGNTDDETTKLDGNNVNADVENVELARAQIHYDYLIKQVNDQFTRLRTVISGQ